MKEDREIEQHVAAVTELVDVLGGKVFGDSALRRSTLTGALLDELWRMTTDIKGRVDAALAEL